MMEDYLKASAKAREEREKCEHRRRLEMREAFKTTKVIHGKRKLKSKRPIIQCQMCGKTGNYWAPCFVAPVQIGEEDFVIGYEEFEMGFEVEEASLVL